MKTVLILTFSELTSDPRVNRQIKFLEGKYNLIACGFGSYAREGAVFIEIKNKAKNFFSKAYTAISLLLGFYESVYWSLPYVNDCLVKIAKLDPDLIIANDINTLPIALKIKKTAKVIFDAHEYFPDQFGESLFYRVFNQSYDTYLCRQYSLKSDIMTTVSTGIAKMYKENIGASPIVVTNAKEFVALRPRDNRKDPKIRIIHHGFAMPSRRIENMVNMMNYLDDRFELYLMLKKSQPWYFNKIKSLIFNKNNIFLIPPVEMPEICRSINKYDIGLHMLICDNPNTKYSLPNKFYEFIQARLAVAVSPSPEMKEIVEKYDLGIVSSDFSAQSMAKELGEINQEKIFSYKNNADKAAYDLSAEKNKESLLASVDKLMFP